MLEQQSTLSSDLDSFSDTCIVGIGITAKLDDDLLKFYCNEDTFLMQVTAIELEGMEAGQDSIMYDITLCEI